MMFRELFLKQSMVDIVDSATRSRMMSGIRGRDTKPEKLIRSLLHRRGFRFRVNRRDLPGKPDIVFPGRHAVILIHGCFWHGHDCPLFRLPGTRTEFWAEKIAGNRRNDARVEQALLSAGWRVATVWECALRGRDRDIPGVVDALVEWLNGDALTLELRRAPATTQAAPVRRAGTRETTEPRHFPL
jgi:DNA mismatch endonuclease (patch repair protein)